LQVPCRLQSVLHFCSDYMPRRLCSSGLNAGQLLSKGGCEHPNP
jgi:hypothetical protein